MATGIGFNGFFSDQAKEIIEGIKKEHRQLFHYLNEVNEQAHRDRGLRRQAENTKQVIVGQMR